MAAVLAIFAFGIGLTGCGGDDATTPFSGQTLKIAKPALSKTWVFYTGSEYTVALNPANPAYTLGGESSATEIGDYTATVTLVDAANTEWADGTTAPLSLPWSIEPEKIWYGDFIPAGVSMDLDDWDDPTSINDTVYSTIGIQPFDINALLGILDGSIIPEVDPDTWRILNGSGYIRQKVEISPAATNTIHHTFIDIKGDCIFITPQSQDLLQIRDGANIVCYPPVDIIWNKFPVIINEINYSVYKLKDRPAATSANLAYTFEFN